MDKKKKSDPSTPAPAPEGGGEHEGKKTRRTKAEDLDASLKEPEGRYRPLPDFTAKDEDSSEANVKVKMGLGAKRTKKPPKSLENFICRPTIRVSQKPASAAGDGARAKGKRSNQPHQPAQKKPNGNSRATKTSSSTTSKDDSRSTESPPVLTASPQASPDSDCPDASAAKKILPKQARQKTDSKQEEEPPNTAQPPRSPSELSIAQKIPTSTKQTSSHMPCSPASLQQDSSPQEGVKRLNENRVQQAQAFPNSSQEETKERSSKRNSVPSKQTSSLPKKDSEHTEKDSETFWSVSRKKVDGHVEDSGRSSDSRTMMGEKNVHQNDSMQKPSPCAKDQADDLSSVQAAVPSSLSNPSGNTPNSSETSKESKGQDENEDLNRTLEVTMKSSKVIPIIEQQKDTSTEGSPDNQHGKRIKRCPNQEQMKSHCLSDADDPGDSVLNPRALPSPAKPSVNISPTKMKKDKKSSKTQKPRHPHSSKIAKKSNSNDRGPVASMTERQGSSEHDALKAPSSLQCKQKAVGQHSKSKQSKNVSVVPSAKKYLVRKRGRPKANKLKVPLQGNNLEPSSTNSPNNQGPNPELVQQPRSTPVRKRGRPKRNSSVDTQPTQSNKQDTGDQHVVSEDKVKDSQQKCNRSNRVIMKTIIRKINKMKVKRRDQLLTQILLGQKQRDSTEFPQEGGGAELSSPASPATHSLSSLVTSFGGKLGPQINVSKRGTIYMGKRRGRKPKYDRDSGPIPSPNSQQVSADTAQFSSNSSTMCQSLNSQTPSSLKKNATASLGRSSQLNLSQRNTQKVRATSFMQLSEQNSRARSETPFASNTGVGVNDNSMLDRTDRETNGRLAAGAGFPSTLATGSVFTMSGLQGNNSVKGKAKTLSSFPSEHPPSARLPLGSGRIQDSNGTHIANPLLSFPNQEAHKFKCHRRGHHCLSRDKLRRHKYKCKRKYMQLKAKRQDPEFLAEVEDLIVRLREIHIVHHMTRTRLGEDGSGLGRKSVKGKSQSKCLQEDVHPPTMFQINFSGYYSPHSTLSCDPVHYVRMANMRRKHGCSSEPSEQIVTHFPVMHKLGYPVPSGGFFHPSYKVPFTTASLGFGLYRGYPSTAPLYPSSFPSSYVHHYSKNPIISPSKFHKKKTKVPKTKDSGGPWGGKYPRMTPNFSCDCFSRQSWQREKQKEKSRDGRDGHGRMREREQDVEWLLWQNKISNNNENSRDRPSSFSIFSNIQNKDKTFPSNLRQAGEVRWSEHQPPWQCTRGFESKLGNRGLSQEFHASDHEDTPEGPESDGELTTPQQSSRRTHSFLKQPKLFTSTQNPRRIRKGSGVTSVSTAMMERDGTPVQDFSSLGDKREGYVQAGSLRIPGKHQCSNSPSAREADTPKGHKARRRPLIQDEGDQACDRTPAHFMHEHNRPRNTAATRAKPAQLFRSFKTRSPAGLDITAGHQVKKRGPGRPRKNPPPSPHKTGSSPSLSSAPPPPPSLPEEKEKSTKGGSSKRKSDVASEAVVAVIHAEPRKRGRKRKCAEEEKDEAQKQSDEEEDAAEASSDVNTTSTAVAPSPDQAVAVDADSQSEKTSSLPPTKKYLWAGLYSDVYKTEDVHEPEQLRLECVDYNPEEHEHGLLPAPLHVGKYLRLKRIDFQLPYDVHWLCVHDKLLDVPDGPPSPTACGSSCEAPNERTPQNSDDDDDEDPCSRSIDRSNQADVPELQEENQQSHQPLQQQEGSRDTENFPSSLSSEERTFVMRHGVFLVRNYEKMRARQALLLMRQEMRERENEEEEEEDEEEKGSGQSENGGNGEETTVQPDRCLSEPSTEQCPENEELSGSQSRSLSRTLLQIWDSVVGCKGSSGQTLTAPLLNLCSRKRSDSALLDLSMVQKQLHSGHYNSLEAFHADMLKVFHCAEKYYGCESSVGRDVSQLRVSYHKAHQEASANTSSFL